MRKTLDCLDMAYQSAPKEHMDVVLVSLGSTVKLLGLPVRELSSAGVLNMFMRLAMHF